MVFKMGSEDADVDSVVNCIDYAVENGTNILNCSFSEKGMRGSNKNEYNALNLKTCSR